MTNTGKRTVHKQFKNFSHFPARTTNEILNTDWYNFHILNLLKTLGGLQKYGTWLVLSLKKRAVHNVILVREITFNWSTSEGLSYLLHLFGCKITIFTDWFWKNPVMNRAWANYTGFLIFRFFFNVCNIVFICWILDFLTAIFNPCIHLARIEDTNLLLHYPSLKAQTVGFQQSTI